jgi:hypothetical protein
MSLRETRVQICGQLLACMMDEVFETSHHSQGILWGRRDLLVEVTSTDHEEDRSNGLVKIGNTTVLSSCTTSPL